MKGFDLPRKLVVGGRVVRRSEMSPGDLFAAYQLSPCWRPMACVVVDRLREVEFWTGIETALGDVAPSAEFEVLT